MDVLAWPSWSAPARQDRSASSMRVATVLRKTWEVTQSEPAVVKASRRSAGVLEKDTRASRAGAAAGASVGWVLSLEATHRLRQSEHLCAPSGSSDDSLVLRRGVP